MKWAGQVVHVATADARRARWLLLVYVALSALAAVHYLSGASLWPDSDPMFAEAARTQLLFTGYLPVAIVLLACIAIANVVQADPPAQPSAFWTSLPLAPSAMFVAKTVVAGCVLSVLAVLAAFTALRSFDISAGDAWRLVPGVAFSFGRWLLAAAILGAVTAGLWQWAAASCVAVAAWATTIILLDGYDNGLPSQHWFVEHAATLVAVASIAAGLGLLILLYRNRRRVPGAMAVGVLSATGLMWTDAPSLPARTGRIPHGTGHYAPALTPVDPDSWIDKHRILIHADTAGLPPASRVDLEADLATFGGPRDEHFGGGSRGGNLWNQLPPLGQPVRWLVDRPSAPGFDIVDSALTDGGIRKVGLHAVTVRGTVTLSSAHVVADIPLTPPATVTAAGHRISLVEVTHDSSSATVHVVWTAAPRASVADLPNYWWGGGTGDRLYDLDDLQFVLVNRSRGEAILVDSEASGYGADNPVVLPWLQLEMRTVHVTTHALPALAADFPRDSAWFAGARLLAVEWRPDSSYAIPAIRVAVPSPTTAKKQ